MTKKDIELLSTIYEQLSLDAHSEGLLNELDQSTLNNAVLKHQEIKDRNPVARNRSDKFSIKHHKSSEKKGNTIQAQSANGDNYIYHIQGIKKINDTNIWIDALRRPVKADSQFSKAVLGYNFLNYNLVDTGIMPNAPAGSEKNILKLVFKHDAQNLAKAINKYTGMNIPWKSMRFSI